jgi:hypothetical protein
MEFDFSLRRVLLLAALLGIFAALGGFSAPQPREEYNTSRVRKAWIMCIVLFVGGALSATVIEHTIGHMDPTNLRPAYVFIGVVLMIAGTLWLKSLKQGIEPAPRRTALHVPSLGEAKGK